MNKHLYFNFLIKFFDKVHIIVPTFVEVGRMMVLGQLLLFVIGFALAVIIGTFSYIMFDNILGTIEEHRRAREREKRRK